MASRTKAQEQLLEYAQSKRIADKLTTSEGIPIDDKTNVITVGPRCPMLLQDHVFLDEMAHFDRERVPERVVHAKGAGAFGSVNVDRMSHECLYDASDVISTVS